MEQWSFEVRWPAPYPQYWSRSGRKFDTIKEAATALGEFLIAGSMNGTQLWGRLVKISS